MAGGLDSSLRAQLWARIHITNRKFLTRKGKDAQKEGREASHLLKNKFHSLF